MRQVFGTLLAAFLLVAVLSVAVPSVRADPACGAMLTSSTTLASDISCPDGGTAVYIGADNVVLDCAGHTITGNGGSTGIAVLGDGAVVKNCVVTSFSIGFEVTRASNVTLQGNTAAGPSMSSGFYIYGPGGDHLVGNTAQGVGGRGFTVMSAWNVLTSNAAIGNLSYGGDGNLYYGFHLFEGAANNTLSGNEADFNSVGFEIDGVQNQVSGNVANANSLYGFYLSNSSVDNVVSGNAADPNAYDFIDTSAGVGTGGTANVYQGNSCVSAASPTETCSSSSSGTGGDGARFFAT